MTTVDRAIVLACVPLWKAAAERANSKYADEKPTNNKGRSAALYSADDLLAEHGITFDADRLRWSAYERAIRAAATKYLRP